MVMKKEGEREVEICYDILELCILRERVRERGELL